ncbi:MAG: cytochrome P450, partial [Actinobacteria bacterium]|nr:cytochrome P450 [Actinomycetota bacterium]
YEALRNADPVHRIDDYTVVLTRHDDVLRTLRGPEFARDIEQHAAAPINDPVMQRRRQRSEERSKSILNLDPPDHTRLRRLVTQAFTPRSVERLRAITERMVDEVLDAASTAGGFELIDELAFPIPFRVISEMLDMPIDRSDELREWSQILTATLEPTATLDDLDAAEAAIGELIPFLDGVIADRRLNPGEDVVSALLAAEAEGDRLDMAELMAFVVLLYVAGHETTVNLIGNGVLALLNHPDQLEAWRDDPELDSVAVDELLRFDGPVQQTVRAPLDTVTYRGADGDPVEVRYGEVVITCLGAANRDPEMFAEPNRLILGRPNANRHLAFSSGAHYCLGASLARMEAEIAITRLIRRFPGLHLVGEPRWRDRLTIRGVDRLELAF